MDWRKKGVVTPIRGGVCGSWAFPVVDAVEGITKIKTGKLYTLSVQEIVDCSEGGGNDCTGGFTSDAFEFVKHHGLTTESNYPSKVSNGTCDTKKESEPVTKISDYKRLPADEKALLERVAKQPVAVSVDAEGAAFQYYSSGVFTGKCGTSLDLGVTVIGYGTSSNNKIKYWLIKNSWGTSWGEGGYMRLKRGVAAKGGLCGIALEAYYPII